MKDSISQDDRRAIVDFVSTSDRFTNGAKVKEFEERWSEWLGIKFSLFVSSGSAANLLLISSIIEQLSLKPGDKVIVPAMTWVTNISPIIQLGLEPIFCDIDKQSFSFDIDHLNDLAIRYDDIKLVFVTHLFGIPAPINLYQEIFPEAVFLEDCCESHGAIIDGRKVGTFSRASTFSSYFGHHINTIEGGFVSTNDRQLFELMKAKRSHGLARESSPERYSEYIKKYQDVDEEFLFITDGFNLRNTEINAVLGLSQLGRLDSFILRRQELCARFEKFLREYSDIFDIPNFLGNSSFCLPFVVKNLDTSKALRAYLSRHGVETRPLCSGNLLRQPFLRKFKIKRQDLVVDYLHFHGFFIGNNHLITDEEFERLERLIVTCLKNQ